ncbi:uncharacterized protein PgNI_08805 [Pyricularia grisea]|uniref:Uncharacterized protein n=1 Tax=Pyricularia grisea TaxID=148305 RepID=A0A6P8AU72_PYRGI
MIPETRVFCERKNRIPITLNSFFHSLSLSPSLSAAPAGMVPMIRVVWVDPNCANISPFCISWYQRSTTVTVRSICHTYLTLRAATAAALTSSEEVVSQKKTEPR